MRGETPLELSAGTAALHPRLSGISEASYDVMIRLNDEFIPPGRGPLIDITVSSVPVLIKQLQEGTSTKRRQALAGLVALGAEEELVVCLKSPDRLTCELATAGLWECWLNEEGPEARSAIDKGIDVMQAGQFAAAEAIFEELSRCYGGWAEPVNKQATVLYMTGRDEESLELCEDVLDLKPHHFGAWHGLALCAIRLQDWETAVLAAKEALALQPHSGANREILRLAKTKLRRQ